MSEETRTIQDVRKLFNTCQTSKYDHWAPSYESDIALMEYSAPDHVVQVLMQYFSGTPAQTRVLDVACGSGLVAKKLSKCDFRLFVGVDASEGMLREARETGLYQDLHHVSVGTHPMPVDNDWFDVVTVVGGLYPQFIPISAVRDFYTAAKPGGLVCISRGNYPSPEYMTYDLQLEEELNKMESQGLWTRLTDNKVQKYLLDPNQEENNTDQRKYIPGTIHVFKKN